MDIHMCIVCVLYVFIVILYDQSLVSHSETTKNTLREAWVRMCKNHEMHLRTHTYEAGQSTR